jgi:hypothetical protein
VVVSDAVRTGEAPVAAGTGVIGSTSAAGSAAADAASLTRE